MLCQRYVNAVHGVLRRKCNEFLPALVLTSRARLIFGSYRNRCYARNIAKDDTRPCFGAYP